MSGAAAGKRLQEIKRGKQREKVDCEQKQQPGEGRGRARTFQAVTSMQHTHRWCKPDSSAADVLVARLQSSAALRPQGKKDKTYFVGIFSCDQLLLFVKGLQETAYLALC